MIHFFLIVNKQGRVRIRRNYQQLDNRDWMKREPTLIGEVLMRTNKECNYFSFDDQTIVYKRFTTLTLISGISKDENELAIQELMNVFMDCLLAYFHHITELDIIHNMDRVYMILDEIIINGDVAYISKERALLPLQLLDAGS